MDEKPESSRLSSIRHAVRDFAHTVGEASRELADATEQFSMETLRAVEAARARSEESAATSAEMARQAREAAQEAREASAGLQATAAEAGESLRNQARQAVEMLAHQTTQIQEREAQLGQDLQSRIDEMVARLEAGTAAQRQARESADAATSAARHAAERIEQSASAVQAAVEAARSAAEEALKAAEKSAENVGVVDVAAARALDAAESSRLAATIAEQAGKGSNFAAEADNLLERLETDYSLLTRLLQDLHLRVSGLNSITTSELRPDPEFRAPEAQPVASSWQEPAVAAFSGMATPGRASPEGADIQVAIAAELEAPAIMLLGRIQVTIAPVPDFDRLLGLDNALARVSGVKSVTLADYAQEEVVFRVELGQPSSVSDFDRMLSESAGVPTRVINASETTVSFRID